ncbi:MAG TPA: hypothetical protein VFA04_06810 [Bryobacteraceae bacterium]|nr:hypothetical protein [Bryobacteraceae bacterium]
MKAVLFNIAVFSCTCFASSQYVVPVIYLSSSETATAQRLAADLNKTQTRANRAKIAWEAFEQNWQTAHPELKGLKFSDDFRVALGRPDMNASGRETVAAVELSPAERQRAESLFREMQDSATAFREAQQKWVDFQHSLILDHARATHTGVVVTTSSGRTGVVSEEWGNIVAFTSDFRTAVPASY